MWVKRLKSKRLVKRDRDLAEGVQEAFWFRNPYRHVRPVSVEVEPLKFERGREVVAVPASVMVCGKRSVLADNGEWRVVFPLRCNSWACEKCRKKLSKKWIKKISPTSVERFITLTVDPSRFSDPGEALKAIYDGYKKLIQAIRRDRKKDFQYFSVIEFTKKGWPHLHILQRGSYLERKWLSEKWSSFGVGRIVDIRQVKGSGNVKEYLAKYLSKDGEAVKHHLRKVRFSKGFFLPAEKKPKLLRNFSFKISMFSFETEVLVQSAGWRLLGKEGEFAIFKFEGVKKCL